MVFGAQAAAAAEVDPAALVQAADHVGAAPAGQGQLPVRAVVAIRQQGVAGPRVVPQALEQGRPAGPLAPVAPQGGIQDAVPTASEETTTSRAMGKPTPGRCVRAWG